MRPPGVYPVQGDTALLVESLTAEQIHAGVRCLDLGTGSGAVALAAARLGAEVTAVDVSWLALATAWSNGLLRRQRLHLRHGDLTRPVRLQVFDLVVSNPRTSPPNAPVRRDTVRRVRGTPVGTVGCCSTGSAGRRRGC